MSDLRCIHDAGALLGEGPMWSADEGAVYWVDIKEPRLFRHTVRTGLTETLDMPEEIGSVVLRTDGGLLVGLRSGPAVVHLDRREIEPLVDPEPEVPGNRLNDGKCDAHGRFWFGTMDDACSEPTGALYRLDPDHRLTRMDANYTVTNGPAWSPDGAVMYHNSSTEQLIYAFDFDLEAGTIHDRRVFAKLEQGFPDGITVDAEGFLWCAVWRGWRLDRYAPDGVIERRVDLPVACPTSCAFGGDEFETLFITTASIDLDDAEHAAQPLAGGLLACDPGVRGLPPHAFSG